MIRSVVPRNIYSAAVDSPLRCFQFEVEEARSESRQIRA